MAESPQSEPGIVSTTVAVSLLMLDSPAELQRLHREGWVKPRAADRWPLVELVQGFARYAKFQAVTATTAQLAAAFGVTKQRVGQVVAEGWFKPMDGKRGVFNWADAMNGYVRMLKDEGRRTSKGAAESRVRDARTADLEQRMAIRSRELIRFEEAEAALETIVGLVRTEFGGLPARVTRDLTLRREIQNAIDAALARIAKQLATESTTLATGKPPVDADAAANA